MIDNKIALRKAAKIARITLTNEEEERLVGEIDEVLQVFSKVDEFNESVEESKPVTERSFREDKSEKHIIDPFSNTKLVENKKFKAPKLVD
ncbi:MAG: hypothetical protein Q7S22_00880 [Candidatus Micrarchaeota archaeon]|nr:hypothetical protein [Candidatus Micrarchaeota archaeon]